MSSLNDLLLRIVEDPNYQTKGSTLTWQELDTNFKLIADVIRELNSLDPGGIPPYDPETEYSIGEYVSFQSNLWEYIYPTPSTGNAPGLDSPYWAIRSAGALAHKQNTDTYTSSFSFGVGSDGSCKIYARGLAAPGLEPSIVFLPGEPDQEGRNYWKFTNNGTDFFPLGGASAWGDLTGNIEEQTDLVDYVESEIANAVITPADASETSKGVAEISTQSESEDAATNETVGNIDHTRIVSGRGLRWFWEKIKTLPQTITAMWSFADVRLTNQAANPGTFKGLIIDETGKVLKEANIIYDPVTKQFKLKAANTLGTGYTLVIVDSNDEVIAQFRNDKSFELGGTSAILEVNSDIESGNAAIRFLADKQLGYRFQDSNFNDYLNFRTLLTDRAVIARQPMEYNYNQGETRVTKQYTITTDTVGSGQTVVFEFELQDLDHYDIKVIHAEAIAPDGASITSLGWDCADVRKVAATDIEGNVIVATQSRLPSAIVSGGFNWNLDTVNQKIQYRFQNVTGSGKEFVIWVDVSYVRRTTPVLE